jgi:DNA repair protein RecO (recombination protein O)
MNTFKARGLILREYEAGESDKRLSLLCKGRGRILVYAKGAKKPKSKFLAASQMFTYGDFILAEGRQFFSLSQAEIITNFYPIRQDYNSLCHAQYLLEICEKTIPDNTPCDDLLRLLLKTLQHISKKQADISEKQAVLVFMFRFFLFYGLAPDMSNCVVCGAELKEGASVFCDEGLVCKRCQVNKVRMKISPVAAAALAYILGSDINTAFMFKAEEQVLKELEKAARLCWIGHFNINLRTGF